MTFTQERGLNMKRISVAVVVLAALVVAGLVAPAEARQVPTRECSTRHSRNCVWDGLHSGHKHGRSFYRTRTGRKVYITHRRAHRIVTRWRKAHTVRVAPAPAPAPPAPLAPPRPIDPRTVYAAIGDSITYGYGTSNSAKNAWPVQAGIDRRGVPGRCLAAASCRNDLGGFLLDDFPADSAALGRPVLIALIGINDVRTPGLTLDRMVTEYDQLQAMAQARGIRLVLSTLTPFGDVKPEDTLRVQVNQWIRSQADYIDLESVLIGPDGLMRPEYNADGVHPNDAGAKAMAGYVRAWMADDLS